MEAVEQCLGLGERGLVADRCEQFSRLCEWLVGGGVVERVQAASVSEEGVGVFGEVSELLPAVGGVGVEGGGFVGVAGCFGELGVAGVVRAWCWSGVARGDAVGEAGGEGLVVECETEIVLRRQHDICAALGVIPEHSRRRDSRRLDCENLLRERSEA